MRGFDGHGFGFFRSIIVHGLRSLSGKALFMALASFGSIANSSVLVLFAHLRFMFRFLALSAGCQKSALTVVVQGCRCGVFRALSE